MLVVRGRDPADQPRSGDDRRSPELDFRLRHRSARRHRTGPLEYGRRGPGPASGTLLRARLARAAPTRCHLRRADRVIVARHPTISRCDRGARKILSPRMDQPRRTAAATGRIVSRRLAGVPDLLAAGRERGDMRIGGRGSVSGGLRRVRGPAGRRLAGRRREPDNHRAPRHRISRDCGVVRVPRDARLYPREDRAATDLRRLGGLSDRTAIYTSASVADRRFRPNAQRRIDKRAIRHPGRRGRGDLAGDGAMARGDRVRTSAPHTRPGRREPGYGIDQRMALGRRRCRRRRHAAVP
jgi:hypothetical protein